MNATVQPGNAEWASEADWQQSNHAYISAHFRRLRLLLERRVLSLRRRWGSARGTELAQGIAIADAAADLLLKPESLDELHEFHVNDPSTAEINRGLREVGAALDEISKALADSGRAAPLEVLCGLFGLNAFERDVLVLCLAVETDASFARLYAYVQDDVNLGHATVPLALGLFCPTDVIAHVARRCFAPDAALRANCLVTLFPEDSPMGRRALRVDERVVEYLGGHNRIDPRAMDVLEPVSGYSLAPAQSATVAQLADVLRDPEQRRRYAGVNLFGPQGSGRHAIARSLAAGLGLELFAVIPSRMPAGAGERQGVLRMLGREAILSRFAVYVRMDETDGPDAAAAMDTVDRLPTFLVAASRSKISSRRELLAKRLGSLDVTARAGLWKDALRSAGADLNGRADAVAEQFQFGREMMAKTVASACARARMRRAPLSPDDLWDACREQSSWELRQLAQIIEPSFSWDDIVLPPEVQAQLDEITAQVAHRATVYREWGFGKKINRGLGITAMFAGVSGTGKTMAAEVLARHLGLDLYRVDLSGVVSKYIGETEKSLRRIFDAAERSGAILFFDEADALFGKRTEVKDSHDRFANIEVNYLLQRMENFNGLSILATNRKADVDRAFLRRLRFLVDFPFPDSLQRMRIWHKSFPPGTPLGELDHDALGKLEIPGGNIRNIAVSAAFLAAERGTPITMELLGVAARREYAKMEKMIGGAALEPAAGKAAWR